MKVDVMEKALTGFFKNIRKTINLTCRYTAKVILYSNYRIS